MHDDEIRTLTRAVVASTPAEFPAYDELPAAQRTIYEQTAAREGITPETAYKLHAAETAAQQAADRERWAAEAVILGALGKL